jgi:hypothetical protein
MQSLREEFEEVEATALAFPQAENVWQYYSKLCRVLRRRPKVRACQLGVATLEQLVAWVKVPGGEGYRQDCRIVLPDGRIRQNAAWLWTDYVAYCVEGFGALNTGWCIKRLNELPARRAEVNYGIFSLQNRWSLRPS